MPRSGPRPGIGVRGRELGDRGRERLLLLFGGGFIGDQTAEQLTGEFEADPGQQFDDLREGELVEQHPDLGVADRGVVACHRGGERHRQ